MSTDVPPERIVDHVALAEAVRCALAMAPELDLGGIEVESDGADVVLSGTTRSSAAAASARQIAEEIAGVGHVRTLIVIDRA